MSKKTTQVNIAEQKAKAEARLRKQFDFAKMSVADMEAIVSPGGLLERSVWNEILHDKRNREKEIKRLEEANFVFDLYENATSEEKLKLFKFTEEGRLIVKNEYELRKDGIISAEINK